MANANDLLSNPNAIIVPNDVEIGDVLPRLIALTGTNAGTKLLLELLSFSGSESG